MATMWGPPDADDPAGFAFRMYRNYDGSGDSGSRFGETSLDASSTDLDQVSVFASRRSHDGALTVMLINKTTEDRSSSFDVSAAYGNVAAEWYTYDATNLTQIVREADVFLDNGQVELTLPAYSISLLELPASDVITGDFNADGIVDSLDIDRLCTEIRSASPSTDFDLNSDGILDRDDMDEMVLNIIGTYYGDANLDRVVDISDFNLWNAHKFTTNDGWAEGNFNCDVVVDASDFNVWNLNKFQSANGSLIGSFVVESVETKPQLPEAWRINPHHESTVISGSFSPGMTIQPWSHRSLIPLQTSLRGVDSDRLVRERTSTYPATLMLWGEDVVSFMAHDGNEVVAADGWSTN